ncbi:sigma-54 interaction domain-containing protein [Brevibacillus sp. B_LB10_24]|uniref:sigma-54 interaction domain-containing protein n=1 Tax=Brevibacillus sp. B_LB10_24 TaxID=3380645 RepID=UPI0038B93757
MKKVAIIAGSLRTAASIANQLDSLFGTFISFTAFSLEDWPENNGDFDMVLISTHTIFTRRSAPKIKTGTVVLVIRRTVRRDSWERVMAIPSGERFLLVNDEKDSAEETIALLRELGAGHIEYVPYYPETDQVEQLSAAITPGESQYVPPFVRRVVDIGERVVDVSTMVDMLTQLGILHGETREILLDYTHQIITRSQGLQVAMQGLINTKNLLQLTLDMVQDGVIAFDNAGRITLFNPAAETIFACSNEQAREFTVDELLLREGVELESVQDSLVTIRKQKIWVNKQVIKSDGHIIGGVLTLKAAKKVEELELKLRIQSKGHEARYTFSDLISKCESMKKLARRAEKMAMSDLSVLILGESGTGKELFAHAIHQASPRAAYPFVAVNCGALPDNLLESELFGYEDGAFTGAKKGGKPGLFEQAHKGTIFLDEIGDISVSMQSRLLRVLQQKEVLKVGGTRLLPVDVRIIAATNRDLRSLVAEGKFRDDLFYRLKVLQLEVPPLRERREDILLLASHFLQRRDTRLNLGKEIQEALLRYHWPGNVRELENAMEYLAFMNEGSLTLEDISAILEAPRSPQVGQDQAEEMVERPLFRGEVNPEHFILNLMYQARLQGGNTGRRAIVAVAKKRGLALSENEVRKTIEQLRQAGLIEVMTGRAGCRLTEKGYRYIQNGIG